MTSKTQERFRFSFPNTEAGRELRRNLAESFTKNEIAFREFEEIMNGNEGDRNWLCVLLTLEVTGKRPGEGQIAAEMKLDEKT